MTRPGEAEAVEAVLHHEWRPGDPLFPGAHATHEFDGGCAVCRKDVPTLIAAAYPVIAAAVREQVAQEIEARPRSRMSSALSPTPYQDGYCDGWNGAIDAAARIARGSS